jgi:uncharacterized protein YjaG (DUF416 family)
MRHEIKKICKIVDELTTLLLKEDTNEVDFKIKKTDIDTTIYITDYNTKYQQADVEDLKQCLNVQRQHEVEEYYWQLVGECDNDSELTVIGAMIDKAEIELRDGNLYMVLVREK